MSTTTRLILRKIEEVLINNPNGLTFNTILEMVGEEQDRIQMCLDFLEIIGKIEMKLVNGHHFYIHLRTPTMKDTSEQIEDRKRIQENEERLKFALRGAKLGTWDWDATTNLSTFDELYAEMLGYSLDEIDRTIEGWLDKLHPEDRERAFKKWEDAMEGKTDFYLSEHRMRTKSGEWVWVQSSGGAVEYDENGHITRVSGATMDISERKEIEQALQGSEENYRVLFSESPISLWCEDYSAVKEYLDGLRNSGVEDIRRHLTENPEEVLKCADLVVIQRVNKATVELQGVEDESFLLGSLGKIFHDDAIALFREEILALVSGETSYTQEITLTTSNGEKKSLILQVSIPEENVDTLDKVIVSMLDITDRKRVEEALRESEERYRTIINSMHDIIFVHDKDDYFTGVYAADEKYLVKPASEFIGTHPSDSEASELYELFRTHAANVRETGNSETYDYSLIIDGMEAWFTAVLSLHEDGESIVAVARPVTEQKQAEKLLRESQQMLKTVLNAMPQYVFWKDTDLRFLGCNENFAERIGFESPEDIIGLDNAELGIDSEIVKRTEELDRNIMETNKPRLNHRSSSKNKDGSVTWFEGSVIPLHDDDGEVIGILGMTQDITNRVEMDKALKESEARYRNMAEIATLYLDLMGHDLSNQLQVLYVGTEILELAKLPEECVPIVDDIKTSVEYSQDLIAKVKSTQGFLLEPLVETSLPDAILLISSEFKQTQEDVELNLELGVAEAQVLADEYIKVLLLNLLENAVVHNPNKRKKVWIKLNSVVDGFEVQIADNGLGLSDKQKAEILDPSRRYGGIGVHQARNIVNKYGGNLSVTDRVKGDSTKGAEFRIFFPRKTSI